MRHLNWRHLSWLLLVPVMTACAAGTPRTLSDQYTTYDYGDFYRVSDGKDTRVIVRGNPFNIAKADLDKLVTANMEMPRGPHTNYTTAPANAHPDYEVVWLFNGPATAQPNEVCRDPQAYNGQSGAPADKMRVLAAWCRYDKANSWVEGWLDGGPQGAPRDGVVALVQQMTRELFPTTYRNDPQRDSCHSPFC